MDPAPESETFPSSVEGLPEARRPETIEMPDGGEARLEIAPVAKTIAGATVRMLAYNGSIPGPTLVVDEGSTRRGMMFSPDVAP